MHMYVVPGRLWLRRLALVLIGLLLWPTWRLAQAGWDAARAEMATGALKGRTVVVDPGHGGDDPGAVSADGMREKRLVLEIAQKLKARLEAAGAKVVMTREEDVHLPPGATSYRQYVDLKHRVEITNNSGADLMVSIHANKFPQSQYRGAQVWYDKRGVPDCQRLAVTLMQELQRQTKTTRWIQTGEFYITHYAQIPAALVEVGFLSNPQELALLQDPAYQEKLAGAVTSGIARFLDERRTAPQVPPAPGRPNA